MSADRLYTPALLAAAVELADHPPLENAQLHGEARSTTCGSTIAITLNCASTGAIQDVGMRVHACAVGQAAAAVFARHARLRSFGEVSRVHYAIVAWVAGQEDAPDWPDLGLLAPATAFPARHGAILLPWKAAMAALSSDIASS